LIRLGPPLSTEGRYHESQRVLEEGLALSRPLGLWDEVAIALQILGANAAYRGDWSMARSYLAESVAVGRRRGDLAGLVYSLVNLAAEWREGDLVEAGSLACEASQAARSIGDDLGTLLVFVDLAIVAAKSGDARRSGLFWGASERLDEALGETMWRRERPEYEEQLGEPGEGFAEGVAEGRRLSVDEAVALALESG